MAEPITRAAYLAHSLPDQRAAHRAYYAQFVTSAHFSRLKSLADRIKCSQDYHFNDIELRVWDRIAIPVPAESARIMRECGDFPTLAGAVCILKEAAQQIKEGSYNG